MKDYSAKASPVFGLRSNAVVSLFGMLLAFSSPAYGEEALRLRIDRKGGIFELSGNKVGELIDKKETKLTVDARGNILDSQRRLVGRLDVRETGEPTASQTPSDEVGVKVDRQGNIFDESGNIIGRLHDESKKGRQLSIDGSGNIIDGNKRTVGKIRINGVPAIASAAPAPVTRKTPARTVPQSSTQAPRIAQTPPRPSPIYDLANRAARNSQRIVSNAVTVQRPVPMDKMPHTSASASLSAYDAQTLSRKHPNVIIVSELAPYVSFPDGRRKRVIIVDDITYRRHELDSRIDERIAEGKLTEADARVLRQELASSKPMEDGFRSDGMDFKESRKMYNAFDRVASRIDSFSKKRRMASRR